MQPHGRILLIKSSKLQWIPVVLLAGCVPVLQQIRQYAPRSPHRQIAIMPFELMPNQRDIGRHATDIMEVKLRRMNFIITNRQDFQVFPLAAPPRLPDGAFEDVPGAADSGRRLGAQAVLLGIIDEAYEHIGNTPPRLVSAVAIRLRLVDVASGRVFWQGAERSVLPGWKLYDVLNRVTDILTERMGDDFITQNL